MKINGSLELVQDTGNVGVSFLKNAIIERLASDPTGITGRIYYNTVSNFYKYYDGTMWQQFASAAEAGVTSITAGTGISVDASTGAVTVTNAGVVSFNSRVGAVSPTSGDYSFSQISGDVDLTSQVTGVLPAANGGTGVANSNTITLGGDLTTGGAFTTTPGNDLTFTTTGSTNVTLPTSGTLLTSASAVTSITGTTNQIAVDSPTGDVTISLPSAVTTGSLTLTGLTAKSFVFSGVGGLLTTTTAPTNGQILVGSTGNSPVAATLTGGTGISITNGAGSITVNNTGVTSVDISTTSAGISVGGGPVTTTGTLTVDLNAELQALSGLSGVGFVVRTGSFGSPATPVYTERSITGTAGNITVTNGDGVSSSPTINLATVSQGASGSFLKFTLDTFGRVIDNTAVTTGDITTLVDSQYLRLDGTTTPTADISFGGFKVTSVGTPTAGTDATNKNYVDAIAAGLEWKAAAQAATTTAGTLATSFAAGTVIDGYTLVLGDRLLIKDQADPTENGIYVVTALVPTRATDAATTSELNNATLFVTNGTLNGDTGWTQTTKNPVVGTDPVVFQQFTGAGTYVAGTGLNLTGNTFSVLLGAGIAELPTGDVGIDLFDASTGALILTDNGTTRATDAASQLYLLLASGSGLSQGSGGLTISAAGVTNAMLAHSAVTLDADAGTESLALGDTLMIQGTAAQGISTALTLAGSPGVPTYTITAADAGTTSSNKGVSWFDPAFFTTSAGEVSWNTSAALTVASLTDTGLTAHGLVYGNGSKVLTSLVLGAGQLAIGTTSGDPVAAALTQGTGITITSATGSITIANAGVTSFNGGTTGLTPASATAGDITLAGTLVAANGGTGQSSYTTGDILYASSSSALSKLAIGGAHTVLHGGTTPSYSAIDLTTDVTGTLPVGNGGTGITAVGAAGNVVASTGSAFASTPVEFVFDSTLHGGPKKAYKITHSLNQQAVNVAVYDQTATANYAVTAVSTGSGTFTIAGDHHTVFVAGFQFAVIGSTGNDSTYSVVSSSFGGVNTVITVVETVADGTADGTVYVGPNQIIPQQVMQVDANNTIVTFNTSVNVFVVIAGITGVAAA